MEFFAIQQGDEDEGWAANVPLDEALVAFDCSGPGGDQDDGHGSDDPAPSISGSPPGSPLSPMGDLETIPEATGAPIPRPSPAADHLPARALLLDLPGIIRAAADRKGISVPAEPPPPARDILRGDIYGSEPALRRPPVWPRVTELQPFTEAAFSEPGKLKAPVVRYQPFTRVQGLSESGFPGVPRLEESLATILLPKAVFFGRRKPTPPSAHDQVLSRLTDRAHQCAAQTSAAANNVALLASSVSAMAMEPGALPPEMATEIGKAMSAILSLSTAQTTAQARVMAWLTMIQRNMWLHMSQLPASIHKELLDGPISPDGLFGPLLQSATAHLHQASEEADRVQRHTAWSRAAPRPQRPQSSWHGRRDPRRQKRTAAAAAPAPQPAAAPPQQAGHFPPAAPQAPRRPAGRGRRPASSSAGAPPHKQRRY